PACDIRESLEMPGSNNRVVDIQIKPESFAARCRAMDIRFRRRTDRRVILIAVLFAATFAEHLAAATRPAGGATTSGPLVVAGNDGPSTMYGVYELIERLGVTFRLTGDIIPPRRDTLEIPPLDLRQEPAMSRRGFLVPDAGYENITMFSYEDYAKLIDQMAK